jgi:hypothetical protein
MASINLHTLSLAHLFLVRRRHVADWMVIIASSRRLLLLSLLLFAYFQILDRLIVDIFVHHGVEDIGTIRKGFVANWAADGR